MRIAIDLTPLRFDGCVGGGMPFSLELTKALSEQPGMQIIVLTADWNDVGIRDFFSCNNAIFLNMNGTNEANCKELRSFEALWIKVRRKIHRKVLLHKARVDILFCPLSALSFWTPGIPAVS